VLVMVVIVVSLLLKELLAYAGGLFRLRLESRVHARLLFV
jgi:hypothetical protein